MSMTTTLAVGYHSLLSWSLFLCHLLSSLLLAGSLIMELFPYKYWKVGYKPLAEEYGVHHRWVWMTAVCLCVTVCMSFCALVSLCVYMSVCGCVCLGARMCALTVLLCPSPLPASQMQSQGPVSSSHYLLYLFSQRQCMLSHWCRDFSRNENIIMTPDMLKSFLGLGA